MTSMGCDDMPAVESTLKGVETPEANRDAVTHLYDDIFVSEIYHHPDFRVSMDPVIVDVGANVGLYSIWARQRYMPRAIYCYEPSPVTFSCLTRNLRHFIDDNTTNIYSTNAAVTDVPNGQFVLYQSRAISATSTLLNKASVPWIQRASQSGELETFAVRSTTISAEIEAHGLSHIDILKIDAEGYFREVLRGIDTHDYSVVANIVVEADYLPELGLSADDLDSMLARMGYRTSCLDRTRTNNLIFHARRP
jgi:FkbM family methyltransferase